jgi:hypothetical protein
MFSIWAMVDKRIEKLGAMRTLGYHTKLGISTHKMLIIFIVVQNGSFPLLGLPILCNLIQDIYLIVCCLNIMLRTFLNL